MYTQNESTAVPGNDSKLSAEVKEWAFGIRCVFVVLNILPLYYCTRVLLTAPKFERIFEDMLGSKAKLPTLTNLLLDHALPLLAAIWLFTALATVLMFTVKRARYVWVTAVVTALTLIVTGQLALTALFEPLVVVIQNLSGGGENSP